MMWTDDKIATLKQLWADGLTASIIGDKIGMTRSAVLGKVHRLKLHVRKEIFTFRKALSAEEHRARRERDNAARVVRQREERAQKLGEKMMDAQPRVTVKNRPAPFEGALNIPFADLRKFSIHHANQCRYIASEPPGPLYISCGNETLPGEAYCGHCDDIVHNRAPSLTDDERARRSAHMKRVAQPGTIAGVDIADEAA